MTVLAKEPILIATIVKHEHGKSVRTRAMRSSMLMQQHPAMVVISLIFILFPCCSVASSCQSQPKLLVQAENIVGNKLGQL